MAAVVPSTRFMFTDDNKVIVSMIKAFAKRNARLHEMVHAIAVSCILHAVKHGNSTPTNDFLASFDLNGKAKMNGWRLNHLREWFEVNGPFKWVEADKKTGKPASFKMDTAKAEAMRATDMQAFASAVPTFWERKVEAVYRGFDLNAEIIKLVKRTNAALKDDNPEHKALIKVDANKAMLLAQLVNLAPPKGEDAELAA